MNVRESILMAGVTLLQEKGIAALTQPQVAKAAGIKQSHLTYYFPTRADLLLAIAELSITTAMETVAARLGKKPAQSALAATLSQVMTAGLPPRVIVGLIVAADAEPEIRKSLRKFVKLVRGHVQGFLAKAGLAATADDALLFHATIVGLAVMHQARLNPESVREVKAGVTALLRRLGPPLQNVETGD